MEVIVLDWNFKYLESFSGVYKNGVLVHKRGERIVNVPLTHYTIWRSGGTIEEMEFDYHKTIDVGKQRLAVYQWDGKNLHQLSFQDVPESSTIVDFKNEWERAKLAEETALKPPIGSQLVTYANILLALAFIVSAFALIWATNNVVTTYKNVAASTPIVNISKQNAQVMQFLVKQNNLTQRQLNYTLAVVSNVTHYIYTHGG